MRLPGMLGVVAVAASFLFSTSAFSSYSINYETRHYHKHKHYAQAKPKKAARNYAARLPQHYNTGGERAIVIDPRVHAWGAYDANGNFIRGGLATAGSGWCPDIRRSCRTKVGTFRIKSLGSAGCRSSKYPLPRGGAKMPYCMFFNGKQGLHGSYEVVAGNVSHGCVRVKVSDAHWIRFNFAGIGTKVIVRPY